MTYEIKATAPSRAAATNLLDDWALLNIEMRSRFILGPDGRLMNENDPDRSPAPLMFMAGCQAGNLVSFSREVDEATRAEITDLALSEPPLAERESTPRHLQRYIERLSRNGGASVSPGLSFHLPHGVQIDGDARLVFSDTPEGAQLLEDIATRGMPPALVEIGFHGVEDLWAPWCLALQDGEVASLAFAARLGSEGAELGLATSPPFRGRGLAAAATAGWTRHPDLAGRTLFYSTARTNLASQRVVAKLGLRFIGATMGISREA